MEGLEPYPFCKGDKLKIDSKKSSNFRYINEKRMPCCYSPVQQMSHAWANGISLVAGWSLVQCSAIHSICRSVSGGKSMEPPYGGLSNARYVKRVRNAL